MTSQVFPLAVFPSQQGQRRALAASIPAAAALGTAAGGLTAAPQEQPLERGTL